MIMKAASITFVFIPVSSVQFSRSVISDSLRPHGLQDARPACPSPILGVHTNSCPVSQWCHLTISSSVVPFSSCLQSFPASGSFQMTQIWFPLGWTGWISLQTKGLSRVFSNTTVQKHQFFNAQLSLWSNSHIYTCPLEKPYLWLDGPLLTK